MIGKEMIVFVRSADLAPGKVMAAMKFAAEIAMLAEKIGGSSVTVMLPIGGNPNQILWRSTYDDLAGLEAAQTALMASEEYMSAIAAAADLFLPGSIFDRILRTVN